MDKEQKEFLEKNKRLWELWTNGDINSNTEYTIIFRFYAVSMRKIIKLRKELERLNIQFELKKEKRFLFLKEYIVNAIVQKNWSMAALNEETITMYNLSKTIDIIYVGCERKTII